MGCKKISDDMRQKIIENIKENSRYMLFISIDIVNSTKYKQKYKSWPKTFKEFNEDFHTALVENLKDYTLSRPVIWKYLGDEILYNMNIESYNDVFNYINLFKATIKSHISKMSPLAGLSLKSTVWTAGFPVKNIMIGTYFPIEKNQLVTEKGKKSDVWQKNLKYVAKDYIGPSIDIGFRISKYSSETRMVISSSVFRLLLESDNAKKIFNFHLGEHEVLKGVVGEYPIIYIDNTKESDKSTDSILKELNKINLDKPMLRNSDTISDEYIEKYCLKYMVQNKDDSQTEDIDTKAVNNLINKTNIKKK